MIACYAIVSGLFGAVGALEVRTLAGRRWMLSACLLAVLCGVFLLLAPGAGILGIVTVVGGYAIVVGAVLIVGAVQLESPWIEWRLRFRPPRGLRQPGDAVHDSGSRTRSVRDSRSTSATGPR
ncbi:DUF308 domain-containing protein [Rhodococcus sp. T2V]|nr:DUF308 domain-containing protein [Rhodococcus sp. T2V]MDF3312878.1 DUF308 domain-containing protein [Rhodococcus sp. T2V]